MFYILHNNLIIIKMLYRPSFFRDFQRHQQTSHLLAAVNKMSFKKEDRYNVDQLTDFNSENQPVYFMQLLL